MESTYSNYDTHVFSPRQPFFPLSSPSLQPPHILPHLPLILCPSAHCVTETCLSVKHFCPEHSGSLSLSLEPGLVHNFPGPPIKAVTSGCWSTQGSRHFFEKKKRSHALLQRRLLPNNYCHCHPPSFLRIPPKVARQNLRRKHLPVDQLSQRRESRLPPE